MNIRKNTFSGLGLKLLVASFFAFSSSYSQTRIEIALTDNWKFFRGANEKAFEKNYNDRDWKSVKVPHDWAISGPFDKEIDKQMVAITQNGETKPTEKTGRTGSLPYTGEGWYRNTLKIPALKKGQRTLLLFDGAMSEPRVYLNGKLVGQWNYGYNSFYLDITDQALTGELNSLAVHLSNRPKSSRWYPGAGLYRNVHLIIKNEQSIEQWGVSITTPVINDQQAKVNIKTRVTGENIRLVTQILDAQGKELISANTNQLFGQEFDQNIAVKDPNRWSPEHPYLYTAVSKVYEGDVLKDEVKTRFGIREIKYEANKGFSLNGQVRKFKGVCLHHDLGPLGTAINTAALRRQLTILKDLGCDAIRSSHNMPSPEQLELCDEMGFMFLAESFDEWAKPKVENGYHLYFDTDAEKDVVNLVKANRNHPSIVMWSSGNEVPDQWGAEGVKRAKWLQDIFHREDPTRPVTVGMDQVKATMESGFGALLDVPGLNYRVHLYPEAYEAFPQGFILGSETASTVSSRGIYKFPVVKGADKQYPDLQSSSYDLEYCSWSNVPDDDFVLQDDKPWVIGEFVWTGFDYLGEPTPYDEMWPSRSSYFGICDLAGIPKDRYYLYRSRWNKDKPTLHLLPHWNWEGREGETTPVFVYTSYNSAELFLNGKSLGIQKKSKDTPQHRYRLMWNDVKYMPGTLKVVAYDDAGRPAAEEQVVTAGKPHHMVLEADRKEIAADGKDISFVTVSVVDKDGNPCPTASMSLKFDVKGEGVFKAVCNGDATSLESFEQPTMKLFSGKLVVLVQSTTKSGDITLHVTGPALESSKIKLQSAAVETL
ncbi:beta-galactosidase [Pedobacter sp. BAL39]|uniref:beta-galactosidase GalB n=1 Tax=Pedobacter sp. BAL39 TaxID=391596 RepID=UPI000155B255|nr:beta-galactosidase GalB [Pedobacter sp. BAL39]EDM34640.1 beta-galactosidase [Pedobacter sp. BAL39]